MIWRCLLIHAVGEQSGLNCDPLEVWKHAPELYGMKGDKVLGVMAYKKMINNQVLTKEDQEIPA